MQHSGEAAGSNDSADIATTLKFSTRGAHKWKVSGKGKEVSMWQRSRRRRRRNQRRGTVEMAEEEVAETEMAEAEMEAAEIRRRRGSVARSEAAVAGLRRQKCLQ